MTKLLSLILISLSVSQFSYATSKDTTVVKIDLVSSSEHVKVEVYPPILMNNQIDFIIPKIIPGTYMKINYERFYKNIKAYDVEGRALKVRRRDNHITIRNARQLHKIEYFFVSIDIEWRPLSSRLIN